MSWGIPAQTRWSDEVIPYTGIELRPHFLLERFRLEGSGWVGFRGPCRVETTHLVDWEDRLAEDHIEAREMVHLLGEFFGVSIREGVLMQRLVMSIALEHLSETAQGEFSRSGDDLYWGNASQKKKLSVSIVTASPLSVLLHVGINVDATGAPVAAAGLRDLGVTDASGWAQGLLKRIQDELASIPWACAKVRPVV